MNIPCRLIRSSLLISFACLTLSVADGQQFDPPQQQSASFRVPDQGTRANVGFESPATPGQSTFPVAHKSSNLGSVDRAPKVRTLSTSMTGFGVPFKIDNSDGRYIEVQLYVSRNRGKSWQFQGRKNPSETEFPFYAQGDGEYWFALKTLDRDRRLLPDGDTRPELKVFVDTRRPQLEFAVKTDAAGRVVCKWRAQDLQINPNSVRISYQPVNNPSAPWTNIEYRPIRPVVDEMVVADQIAWWPATTEQQIKVRIQVADQAGNDADDVRTVMVPQVAIKQGNSSTAYPGQPQCKGGVCKIPGPDRLPGPQDMFGKSLNDFKSAMKQQIGSVPEFAAPPKPVPSADFVTASNKSPVSLDPNPQAQNTTPKLTRSNPSQNNDSSRSIEWGSQSVPTQGLQKEFVSSTTGQGGVNSQFRSVTRPVQSGLGAPESGDNNEVASTFPIRANQARQTSGADQLTPITPKQDASTQSIRHVPVQSPSALPASGPNRVPTPNHKSLTDDWSHRIPQKDIQQIRSRRFLLNYNVDSVDPSGVGKVVLWTTRNGGESWKSWATDNDSASPFPVEVNENGIYGFRIVIHSNDGLSGSPPSSGDEADMWVRIDTKAPQAKIISAPYGTGAEAGRLIINWEADDEKLRVKPVKLAYSTNAQGPWTTIEEGIRNTGRYVWKVKRGVPDQIFLRLQVTDAAGNVTVQQLTRPLDVSGLVPRGRISGVQPVATQ